MNGILVETAQPKLRTLKLRALGMGLTGISGCTLAVVEIVSLLNSLIEDRMRQSDLPGLDVPLALSISIPYELLLGIFLILLVIAVAGFSLGAFPGHRARLVFLIPAALLGLATWWVPPASRWMHLAPSTLERQVQLGQFDEAEHLVQELHPSPEDADYLRAQIALHAGDKTMLRTLGEPVLARADRYVYQIEISSDPFVTLPPIPSYAPEILHAIDIALHGQPEAQVGIVWEARNTREKQWPGWLKLLTDLAVSAGLASFGTLALRAWNGMRQRVHRIEGAVKRCPA